MTWRAEWRMRWRSHLVLVGVAGATVAVLTENFPCGEARGHDSEIPGYMTAAWTSEDGSRQVVVVVNSNFSHDEAVAQAMRNLVSLAYCGH